MRLLTWAAVLVVAATTVLATEYRVENANGVLREIEAPTHRQIDSHLMEGFHNQPQDIVGFFQGNNLPRPSGLNSLGGFSGLVPSDGFEPDPPVGGPSPFINPEFSAPHHPPDFGPQAPRPPPAPPNSPAPHSDSPDTHIPLTIIIGPTGKGNRPKDRPNRRPVGKHNRRPNVPGRRRPQKQLVPKRESTEEAGGSLRGVSGRPRKINGSRGREEGVSGFFKSLRRLIQKVI